MEEIKEMGNFKKKCKKVPGPNLHVQKVPGPKLKNSRNYAYSTCCDYSTKFLVPRNGTNTEITGQACNKRLFLI